MPFDGIDRGRVDVLDKMDRVISLLANEQRWCKRYIRTADGRRCILGALADAGAQSLKGPVLLAVCEVTGRDYQRIEAFNDDPLTTHAQVMRVLHRTRENIIKGIVENPMPRVSVAAQTRPTAQYLARLRHFLARFA
ncbi:MAG TPA: hypothetical protein VE397_06260 [Stellaceae bacterium]|nr:hypothetical protein [Stellaceae bacterium]